MPLILNYPIEEFIFIWVLIIGWFVLAFVFYAMLSGRVSLYEVCPISNVFPWDSDLGWMSTGSLSSLSKSPSPRSANFYERVESFCAFEREVELNPPSTLLCSMLPGEVRLVSWVMLLPGIGESYALLWAGTPANKLDSGVGDDAISWGVISLLML